MSSPNRPVQTPAPGDRLVCHRGDLLEFRLHFAVGGKGRAWLRTNLGRAAIRRREIIEHVEAGQAILARDWCDIPMRRTGEHTFAIVMPMAEVGAFQAKAYYMADGINEPVWPDGPNTGIKVEPAGTVAGNMVYTAFVRQFGPNRDRIDEPGDLHSAIGLLDAARYTVIPPSGTFRDLIRELDHILGTLGFKFLQLLPIHPVPTTYARMGRFGSPFAGLDFMDIDPSLAEFDRHTTPMDQFRELVHAVHARSAGLLLDIPINHTGWASALQVHHPEWFARNEDRSFQSPGAWGVTWEDLSRLDYKSTGLWQYMADVFLFWCRHGVDGFRCDAGYMIPPPVWEYIVAKVREQYPDTLFMLEGLGGHPQVMESLLEHSGMNWAYSELFQNYDQHGISSYVSASHSISTRKGLLVHFAETHDNDRLATRSQAYARMRTAMSGLFSDAGAFGITNGLEWFAKDKVDVHGASSLNWGSHDNQVALLARINAILLTHPCFTAGVRMLFVNSGSPNTLALLRESVDGQHRLLVAVNLNEHQPAVVSWSNDVFPASGEVPDLLTGGRVRVATIGNMVECALEPTQVRCLTMDAQDLDRLDTHHGSTRQLSARVELQQVRANAIEVFLSMRGRESLDKAALDGLADSLIRDPRAFCAEIAGNQAPCVTSWEWPRDARRTVMVPPGHLLLVQADATFVVEIHDGIRTMRHEPSLRRANGRHFALISPLPEPSEHREFQLHIIVHTPSGMRRQVTPILQLAPASCVRVASRWDAASVKENGLYALLTNGRGAMAQVRGSWGTVASQYDAMLAANLSTSYPVDRHIFLTRCRAWVVHRGYSQELNIDSLDRFAVEPPNATTWQFTLQTGMGRQVTIAARLCMPKGRNEIRLLFQRRHNGKHADTLEDGEPVTVIVRPDIEDRINHGKTKAYTGPERQWGAATSVTGNGFSFRPADSRCLQMMADGGTYTHEPEWLYMVPHPVDADRGFDGTTDVFSPGYFSLTLKGGASATLRAVADVQSPSPDEDAGGLARPRHTSLHRLEDAALAAMDQFIVARESGTAVIAGYPWFLDWGRDTLIVLRGLLAAGRQAEALTTLVQFARFEKNGTLPNMIHGADNSNRDTSDAPLWFAVLCGDCLRSKATRHVLGEPCGGRTVRHVLLSILRSYVSGTPNGVRMDPDSALVFSPSHFTWMDTNHPAGTPREGYPVEIQSLWYRSLQIGAEIDPSGPWEKLAESAARSVNSLFHRPELGFLSDCLHGSSGTPAAAATPDDHLRPNQLLAITLDAIHDAALARTMLAACEELLVPGAIRSLADRATRFSLPIYQGTHLLNDPEHPFWGEYRGNEETRRKPAYHNGTAWTWLLPSYAEALHKVYGTPARPHALSILSSMALLMEKGCGGQIPELLDGSSPHNERGCGAQAWGVSELLRVQAILSSARKVSAMDIAGGAC
jgi:predicted glycogen debranching enzyme